MASTGQAVMPDQPDASQVGTTAPTSQLLPKPRKETDWSNVQPILNSAGQMYCSHPKRTDECDALTFPTKSAWANHHNKHSRPYICLEPSCITLPGFTYSGGLLRHQREVHKAFGGPKVLVVCPYPYCKRNTGKGFTRKENLNEHVRRCHGPSGELVADGTEGEGAVTDAQTSIDQALETGQGPLLNANAGAIDTSSLPTVPRKRKRVSPPISHQDSAINLQGDLSEQHQESLLQRHEQAVLDPALSQDLNDSNMFNSVTTQSPAMLSIENENLTEQNALLQRQCAYLNSLVQEKDKQLMELQHQLALFTGVPTPAISQPSPYFDNTQNLLQQHEQQQEHQQHQQQQQAQQQVRPVIHHREDGAPSYPRLFTQFGAGIQWAQSQSPPKGAPMQTDGSLGV